MTIGVLGGMGTYATIHLFRQIADEFPAIKEWERPRIIIDNRCTMPSRVRAWLYHEDEQRLINEMTESLVTLTEAGCDRIIIGCNTAHLFLPQIYARVPDLEKKVIHIIDNCIDRIQHDKVNKAYLLASEGTIESNIYQKTMKDVYGGGGIINVPQQNDYEQLRDCIEAVKQNKYTDKIRSTFLGLVNRYDTCILGCTELPILYEKYKEDIRVKIYDPILLAIRKIKTEYKARI